MFNRYYQCLKNAPLRDKQRIHDINILESDYVMSCIIAFPFIANNLKKMYLRGNILNELTSKYYNHNDDSFEILFKQCTDSSVYNIYQPDIVEECKANTEKKSY